MASFFAVARGLSGCVGSAAAAAVASASSGVSLIKNEDHSISFECVNKKLRNCTHRLDPDQCIDLKQISRSAANGIDGQTNVIPIFFH